MTAKAAKLLSITALALLLGACAAQLEPVQTGDALSPCHVVYDASSSRTRLYIYEQTATGWVEHVGPGTGALADPVREIRGKTISDAGAVTDEIVAALDDIRRDGPLNRNGKPDWPAFDWKKLCRIDTAAVYATAGMRLAEQSDADASELHFGVADMGGASVQLAFPCPRCEAARPVRVKGGIVPVYSHSFLGWGQDEAWNKFRPLPACERGIGQQYPDWKITDCADHIGVSSDATAEIKELVSNMDGLRWYLLGAFYYVQDTDIEQFCRVGADSGFEPETSCFRAVYLQRVLRTLGVPGASEHSSVDWALGAVVCTATRCLEVD
jgi:hypothetical protein